MFFVCCIIVVFLLAYNCLFLLMKLLCLVELFGFLFSRLACRASWGSFLFVLLRLGWFVCVVSCF